MLKGFAIFLLAACFLSQLDRMAGDGQYTEGATRFVGSIARGFGW